MRFDGDFFYVDWYCLLIGKAIKRNIDIITIDNDFIEEGLKETVDHIFNIFLSKSEMIVIKCSSFWSIELVQT